ncbi:hypothetical protein QYM36_009496 [Artemia franciscana]|uniref:Uncharacterized protein n=1 Tax=Artemia franciscana TaxID=6661 RepID=A0AA88L5G9_ARTSF|nr:hypothetical protein QYM36_009496 [Artemia franciscana]
MISLNEVIFSYDRNLSLEQGRNESDFSISKAVYAVGFERIGPILVVFGIPLIVIGILVPFTLWSAILGAIFLLSGICIIQRKCIVTIFFKSQHIVEEREENVRIPVMTDEPPTYEAVSVEVPPPSYFDEVVVKKLSVV